jgi:hypothetical protein
MRRSSRRVPPQTRLSRPVRTPCRALWSPPPSHCASHGQARLLACALATLLLLRLLRPRRAARLAPEASTRGDDSPPAGRCVAWRATQCGSQYSTRLPLEDLSCSTVIQPADKRMSGACVKGSRASALRASLVPDSNVSQTPQATASAGNSGFTWRRWRCCVARA